MKQQSFWLEHWLPFIYASRRWLTPPRPIKILNPYKLPEVQAACASFYSKYFNDSNKRTVILGINPGRLGAGITGISFTDPEKLESYCQIENDFEKKEELSSKFIYQWITETNSVEHFYADFIILSVCPLGFVVDGKNINYYDQKDLQARAEKLIIKQQDMLKESDMVRDKVFMLGKGKNFKYFKKLNEKHKWYEEVIALPHPRWVMQYRYHRRFEFMNEMMTALLQSKTTYERD